VVLVGHSYSGAVITVAGSSDKVAGLVYVAGVAPDDGKPEDGYDTGTLAGDLAALMDTLGWIVASAVDRAAVIIGHHPAGLGPGRLGQFPVPAMKRTPTVSRLVRSRYAAKERAPAQVRPSEKCSRSLNLLICAEFARTVAALPAVALARRSS
jgi:pimeloyl-ACP methyl ester carboxylesterase